MKVVISPHYDDAVFSLGDWLQRNEAVVITVFAGTPNMLSATDYDKGKGFRTSREAMQARRRENIQALSGLRGVTAFYDLPFLENQYVFNHTDMPDMVEQVDAAISSILQHLLHDTVDGVEVYVPMAVNAKYRHVDHARVTNSFMKRLPPGMRLFMYADQPYTYLNEFADVAAMEQAIRDTWELTAEAHPWKVDTPRDAVLSYRSQLGPRARNLVDLKHEYIFSLSR